MSVSQKRQRRTSDAVQSVQTKSLRTQTNDNDDENNNNIMSSMTTTTSNRSNNILCKLIGDIIQHHLWPLLSDDDAIYVMQVDRAMCAYYEARVYGLKRGYAFESDAELHEYVFHLTVGPIRLASVYLYRISMSACNLFLRTHLSLVQLTLRLYARDALLGKRLAAFIDATPTLQELDVNNLHSTLYDLLAPLTYHKNIKVLRFSDTSLTADDIKAVSEILRHNAVITEFDLSGCVYDDDGGALIVEALLHNTKLNTLNMDCHSLGIKTATALRDVVNYPTSALTSLQVGWYRGDDDSVDDGAVIFSQAICKLLSFKTQDRLGVRGVTAICNALIKADAQVRDMEFGHCDPKAMSVILSMLRTNTSIRHIDLFNCVADGEEARLLEEALKCNTTLTSINISSKELSTNVISHIESALSVNQTLLCFADAGGDLESNCVQEALSRNSRIQELRNSVSDIFVIKENKRKLNHYM